MGKFRDRVRKEKFDTHQLAVAIGGQFGSHPLCFLVRHDDKFGLDDWLPEYAPPSTDNFCQVNRSIDPLRCAGLRLSAVGLAPEEAFIWGRRECFRHGMRPDTILAPPSHFWSPDFADSIGNCKVFVEDGLTDTVFLLQEDTWELRDDCLICAVPGLNARMTVSGGYDRPTVKQERACRSCKRPNDVGVKSCWWCEASNPTMG